MWDKTDPVKQLLNYAGDFASSFTVTGTIALVTLAGIISLSDQTSADGLRNAIVGFASAGFFDVVVSPVLEKLKSRLRTNSSKPDDETTQLIRELLAKLEQELSDQDKKAEAIEFTEQFDTFIKAFGIALELNKSAIIHAILLASEQAGEKTTAKLTGMIAGNTTLLHELVEMLQTSHDMLQKLVDGQKSSRKESSVVPAKPDEILILIARFSGQQVNDAVVIFQEEIREHCASLRIENKKIRVDYLDEIIENGNQALGALLSFRACLVIWGRDTTSGVKVQFARKILRDYELQGDVYAVEDSLLEPQASEFSIKMNQDVPLQLTQIGFIAAGLALHEANELDASNSLYTKAIESLKAEVKANISILDLAREAYMGRANLRNFGQGLYQEASEDYSEVIRIDDDNYVAYTNRGVMYSRLDNYEKSLLAFKKAKAILASKPGLQSPRDHALIEYNLGNSYSKQKRYREAENCYKTAIAFDDKYDPALYHNYGNLCRILKRYTEAIHFYTEALKLDPEFIMSLMDRGGVYFKLGQIQSAIDDYSKIIEIDPSYFSARLMRAQTYNHLAGKYTSRAYVDMAIEDLNICDKLSSDNPEVLFRLGLLYGAKYENDRAMPLFKRFLDIAPRHEFAPKVRKILTEWNS